MEFRKAFTTRLVQRAALIVLCLWLAILYETLYRHRLSWSEAALLGLLVSFLGPLVAVTGATYDVFLQWLADASSADQRRKRDVSGPNSGGP
jgi:hypothetical protein